MDNPTAPTASISTKFLKMVSDSYENKENPMDDKITVRPTDKDDNWIILSIKGKEIYLTYYQSTLLLSVLQDYKSRSVHVVDTVSDFSLRAAGNSIAVNLEVQDELGIFTVTLLKDDIADLVKEINKNLKINVKKK